MSDAAKTSVLRRKLAPPRVKATPGQSSVQAMLKKTMPRDADKLLGLQIEVTGVTLDESDRAEVLSGLSDNDLIYLMTSEVAAPGICRLTPGLMAALIEVQMAGEVARNEVQERRPTRTDGIILSDIVDRWISAACDEARAAEMADMLPFVEHIRVDTVLDRRNAELSLDPGRYRTLKISIDVAGGARTGDITFAAPVSRKTVTENVCLEVKRDLRAQVMSAQTRLPVVLTTLSIPVGRVHMLKTGDVFEIPVTALGSVRVEGRRGDTVLDGRLGQVDGRKAVRLGAAVPQAPRGSDFSAASPAGDAVGAAPPPLPNAGSAIAADAGSPPEIGTGDGVPDLPDVPDLPGPQDSPETADLPSLDDLPALDDLPPLDDLPELPDLD